MSSGIACTVPDTIHFNPHANEQLRPGETGTLLELTDGGHWIRDIAVSDNYLFIAVSWGGVYRMPKYGGDVVPLDEDPHGEFYQLATDGTRVYWIHVTFDDRDYPYTVVKSQSVDGGATATIARGPFGVFGSSNQVDSFQATGSFVYWAYDTGGDTPGRIDRIPAGGGGRQMMASYADAQSVPFWVADDSGVYLTTDGVVEHLAAGEQAAEVLAPSPAPDARPVGQDANAVYLHSYNDSGVWTLSKASRSVSKIEVVSDHGYLGSAVAFDDTNIYGIDGQTLVRFPKTGGAVTSIGAVTECLVWGGGTQGIAVDPQYVFLICGDSNRIVVAPNPSPQ